MGSTGGRKVGGMSESGLKEDTMGGEKGPEGKGTANTGYFASNSDIQVPLPAQLHIIKLSPLHGLG